jgi:Uma2 family endonuclease
MPHVKKAELIEGVVYMASPVRIDMHAEQHSWSNFWLTSYYALTPGTRVGDNATTRLSPTNDPQPDVVLFVDPRCGGRCRIDNGYLTGSPELLTEVAASSVSLDLGAKLEAYRRNGVCEYVVWRVLDRAIDWFALRQGNYDRLTPGADGIVRSQVFPGLWLDAEALLAGNLLRVYEVLQQGAATAEHAVFVAKLQQALRHP